MVWIRLESLQVLDWQGSQRTYRPGDWVDIGKMHAAALVASGQATVPDPRRVSLFGDVGVVLLSRSTQAATRLGRIGVPVQYGTITPEIPYDRTLYWDPQVRLRSDVVPLGFELLDRWEFAVPLWSYTELARDIGTDTDRARTVGIVRDLRVPVYHPGVLFVRRGVDALSAWSALESEIEDRRLSLLAAIYQTRPLVLALPTSWVEGN